MIKNSIFTASVTVLVSGLLACNSVDGKQVANPKLDLSGRLLESGEYIRVYVWRETSEPLHLIGPYGRISMYFGDMVAAGKTTRELARDIEVELVPFVRDPIVVVTRANDLGGTATKIAKPIP